MRKALLFASLCLLVCAGADARQEAVPVKPHTRIVRVEPPGAIDGSKNPELIPDILAYRMFFIRVSPSDRPEDSDGKRHQAAVGMIPLSELDRITFELAISDFHKRYAWFVEQHKTAAVDESALAERDQITQDEINYLRLNLSAFGLQNLTAYVEREKRHIRRVPMPQMPPMQ